MFPHTQKCIWSSWSLFLTTHKFNGAEPEVSGGKGWYEGGPMVMCGSNPLLSKYKWRNPALLTSVQGRGVKQKRHCEVSMLSQVIGSKFSDTFKRKRKPERKSASSTVPRASVDITWYRRCSSRKIPFGLCWHLSLAWFQDPQKHFPPNHGSKGRNQVASQPLGRPCSHFKKTVPA